MGMLNKNHHKLQMMRAATLLEMADVMKYLHYILWLLQQVFCHPMLLGPDLWWAKAMQPP
jgi:hypothetical protein